MRITRGKIVARQGLAGFLCKGPGSAGPVACAPALHSAAVQEVCHQQCVSERAWVCANKVLSTQTGSGLALACGAQGANPWIKRNVE